MHLARSGAGGPRTCRPDEPIVGQSPPVVGRDEWPARRRRRRAHRSPGSDRAPRVRACLGRLGDRLQAQIACARVGAPGRDRFRGGACARGRRREVSRARPLRRSPRPLAPRSRAPSPSRPPRAEQGAQRRPRRRGPPPLLSLEVALPEDERAQRQEERRVEERVNRPRPDEAPDRGVRDLSEEEQPRRNVHLQVREHPRQPRSGVVDLGAGTCAAAGEPSSRPSAPRRRPPA